MAAPVQTIDTRHEDMIVRVTRGSPLQHGCIFKFRGAAPRCRPAFTAYSHETVDVRSLPPHSPRCVPVSRRSMTRKWTTTGNALPLALLTALSRCLTCPPLANPCMWPTSPGIASFSAPSVRSARLRPRILRDCIVYDRRHEGPVWEVAWAHPKFGVLLASCSYDRQVIIYREVDRAWSTVHIHKSHTASGQAACRRFPFAF